MRINKPAFHVTLVFFGIVGSLILAPQFMPKPVATVAPLRLVQAPAVPDVQARRDTLEACQMRLVLQADAGCADLRWHGSSERPKPRKGVSGRCCSSAKPFRRSRASSRSRNAEGSPEL